MKTLQPLITDRRTYLESAGRADRQHIAQALKEQGTGTALRVCLWRI